MSDARQLSTPDLLAAGSQLVRELDAAAGAVAAVPSPGGQAYIEQHLAALAAVNDALTDRIPPPAPPIPAPITWRGDTSRQWAAPT